MNRKSIFIAGFLLAGLAPTTGDAAGTNADQTRATTDVRIVVDVSGSMRAAASARATALERLIDELPSGSHAGIWTFGQQVNMAVRHGVVDDAWRVAARAVARNLDVVGLRTNVRAALETVMWDSDVGQISRRDIVLISDGRVDLSDEARVNDTERRALIGEVLPRLAASGFVLHGLALSTDADVAFLRQFTAATGGYFAQFVAPADVGEFVARAFARDVSLHGSFMVTPGQAELTVAVVRSPSRPITLVSPAQQRIDADIVSSYVRWFDGDGDRTIVTLANPAPGRWQIEPAPQRMVVLDELQAHVRPVLDGDVVTGFEAYLTNGDRLIEERMLDGLVIVEAERIAGGVVSTLRVRAPQARSSMHAIELTPAGFSGDDRVQARMLGPTFERAAEFALRNDAPIRVDAVPGMANDAVLTFAFMRSDVDEASVRVVSALALRDGRTKLIGAAAAGPRRWTVTVPAFGNEIEVRFKRSGNYLNKKELSVSLDPINLLLPLPVPRHWEFEANGRAVDASVSVAPLPALPAVEPLAAPAPREAEVASAQSIAVTESHAGAAVESPEEVPRALTIWDAIGFGAVAGLNLLALLWFGYNALARRRAAMDNDLDGQTSAVAAALQRYREVLAKAETASINTA